METLANVVPLTTPYSIIISVSNVCDFRCVYCGVSASTPRFMSYDEFAVIAHQVSEFNRPLRQLAFISKGEPLLNKDLPGMIQLVRDLRIAEKIKIITNASKLTNSLADRLVTAGLDILFVSLQGTTAQEYKDVARVDIDINKFVDRIRYFYENRGTCEVHLKIMDNADRAREVFGNICDKLIVENLHDDKVINKHGHDVVGMGMRVCPQPFYKIWIGTHGYVQPCCSYPDEPEQAEKLGLYNILHGDKPLRQIWDEDFRRLQLQLLHKNPPVGTLCNGCTDFLVREKVEDCLDAHIDKILQRFEKSEA